MKRAGQDQIVISANLLKPAVVEVLVVDQAAGLVYDDQREYSPSVFVSTLMHPNATCPFRSCDFIISLVWHSLHAGSFARLAEACVGLESLVASD